MATNEIQSIQDLFVNGDRNSPQLPSWGKMYSTLESKLTDALAGRKVDTSMPQTASQSVGDGFAIPPGAYSGGSVSVQIQQQVREHDANIGASQAALGTARDQAYSAATQQAAINRSKADNGQNIQRISGLDSEDPNNVFATVSAAMFANDSVRAEEHAKLDEMASTNLLDSPIDFIMSRLTIDSQAARAKAADDAGQRLSGIMERTLRFDQQAKQQIQVNTAANDQQLALTQAEQAKAEADARIAALGAQGNQSKMQAIAIAGREARQAAEDPYEQRLKALRISTLEDAEKARQIQQTQQLAFAADMGRAVPLTEADMKNLPPHLKQEAEIAQQTRIYSPELVLALGANLQNNPATAPKYEAAKKAQAGIDATATAMVATPQGMEKYKGASGTRALREDAPVNYANAQKSITTSSAAKSPGVLDKGNDDKFNIYRVDQMAFMDYNAKAAGNGLPVPVQPKNVMVRLMDQVLKSPSSTNTNTGNLRADVETQLIAQAAEMQAAGVLKSADGKPLSDGAIAQQIVDYYRAGVKFQADRNQYVSMGFPEIKNYRAVLPAPVTQFAFNSGKKANVDLTSTVEVANWLAGYVKQKKMDAQVTAARPEIEEVFSGPGYGFFSGR